MSCSGQISGACWHQQVQLHLGQFHLLHTRDLEPMRRQILKHYAPRKVASRDRLRAEGLCLYRLMSEPEGLYFYCLDK